MTRVVNSKQCEGFLLKRYLEGRKQNNTAVVEDSLEDELCRRKFNLSNWGRRLMPAFVLIFCLLLAVLTLKVLGCNKRNVR
jgi:hypothetical protein